MKYAIAASLALMILLAACSPAAPKETVKETIVQEQASDAAVDTGDVEAVTMQVEQIDSDMGLDDLDELDLQLAELDNLELG